MFRSLMCFSSNGDDNNTKGREQRERDDDDDNDDETEKSDINGTCRKADKKHLNQDWR